MNNVRTLAIAPISPLTVYAGTSGSIFKSTDGGNIWNGVSGQLSDVSMNTAALDPKSPQTVYAGTH
jgi:photosystem II stability/assembly factor-like uncharacterized protein